MTDSTTTSRLYDFAGRSKNRIAGNQIRRVLFAADPIDCIASCHSMLRSRGVDVQLVHDGRSCVEQAISGRDSGTPFDLIVLTVDLPVLDGFSTAMLLRENDCARIIISMHGIAHYLMEEESREAGCNLHCRKEKLQSDIESLLAAA